MLKKVMLALFGAALLAGCGGEATDGFDPAESESGLNGRPDACITLWDPVCGVDGKTYSNACWAAMEGVEVAHDGECRDTVEPPRDPPEACITLWDPVCGVDGNTYSNACFAGMAGVEVAYKGECGKKLTPRTAQLSADRKPDVCTTQWDPVCGVDGNTYGNACWAAMAGVEIDHRGECRDSVELPRDPPDACTTHWDPVCGVDGKTYSNACWAAMEGVEVAHHGECGTVLNPSSIQAKPFPGGGLYCPDVWDPVCGEDGRTYSNGCYASIARVKVAHRGTCERVEY